MIQRTIFIPIFFSLYLIQATAQPYAIGHRSLSYTDPAHSRNIPVHIYYPATSAGDNVAVAAGAFPLIVFGHGFAMAYSAYANVWEAVVPQGYIMVLPTTEGSLLPAPNHEAFGLDLRFLNTKMKSENTNASSPFYQKIGTTSALMGHSMGGGASFLAAAGNNDITAHITFAPAETNVSAIHAATQITVPDLIFYGQNDGVTPPAEHQLSMYDSLGTSCKTIIGIKGGGHCYFANYNFNCATGELSTSPQPTITRAEQHVVLFDFLIPYMNYILKNNTQDGQLFLDSLNLSGRIIFQRNCTTTQLNEVPNDNILIYPNPLGSRSFLTLAYLPENENAEVEINDIRGRTLSRKSLKGSSTIDMSGIPSGTYILKILTQERIISRKLVVLQ
ncbi:MAG: Alpha/beta hydrolase family protein [Bacteroidetes bacterium ADurb.Bin408]|nr:MAG: Alpha/beta hydrolase family protein [Bacteroidetes bacterium ADurb.Bin408]